MTAFRTVVKDMQDQLVKQIKSRWEQDKQALTEPLHSECSIFADLPGDAQELKAVLIRVWPPEGASDTEFTDIFTGHFRFPVMVNVRILDEGDALKLLREAVGVVHDAVKDDPTLGGQADSLEGSGPAVSLGAILVDGGEVSQELQVSVIKQW